MCRCTCKPISRVPSEVEREVWVKALILQARPLGLQTKPNWIPGYRSWKAQVNISLTCHDFGTSKCTSSSTVQLPYISLSKCMQLQSSIRISTSAYLGYNRFCHKSKCGLTQREFLDTNRLSLETSRTCFTLQIPLYLTQQRSAFAKVWVKKRLSSLLNSNGL